MSNILRILINFLFILLITRSALASQCESTSNLKIGLINDNFINYKPYLFYTLGNFSSNNNLKFEISIVENNADEFDIIFGEYHELDKLSKYNIEFPKEIEKFYEENNILLSNNIFPLDLDTLILLSHNPLKEQNFQELSNFYDPTKYTLGMNISYKKNLIDLISYNLDIYNNITKDINLESILHNYSKIYKNLNKNILDSNFIEIYDSYVSKENVFTLFSDGILIYKHLEYESFQIFPKSKYIWDSEKGLFKDNKAINPVSNYGFSAYLNSADNFGFLCFLVEENLRIKTFQNFNIQISPLSINEVSSIKGSLDKNYLEILKNKNNFINKKAQYSGEIYDFFLISLKNEERLVDAFNIKNYLDQ